MRRYLVKSSSLFWLTTCQNILFLAYIPFCPELISNFAASLNFADLFHFAMCWKYAGFHNQVLVGFFFKKLEQIREGFIKYYFFGPIPKNTTIFKENTCQPFCSDTEAVRCPMRTGDCWRSEMNNIKYCIQK